MLQQTQVSRVSGATRADVIRAWQGMGYNNRAVRLHELARQITCTDGGRLPKSIDGLVHLPGIGKYTAHAMSCFAFRQPVPVVDTNINRVLSRLFPKALRSTDIWSLAGMILPKRSAYQWNQALMDFGALVCTAANPQCGKCPLVSFCPSAFNGLRLTMKRKNSEPGRDGVPNRIYRGRIVEALRRVNGQGTVPAATMARLIKAGFRSRVEKWFRSLLEELERDGLITVRNRGKNRLPKFLKLRESGAES